MTQKQTQHQIRAVKKMLANKGRRQQVKELKSGKPPEQRPKSRSPRRKDWDADDEDYFTSEKIRRAEKIKAGSRPQEDNADAGRVAQRNRPGGVGTEIVVGDDGAARAGAADHDRCRGELLDVQAEDLVVIGADDDAGSRRWLRASSD